MTVGQELLMELELEGKVTRRFLECVPFDKTEYQPTEKSEKLGRLAIQIAEIVAWWKQIIENSKLDFIDFEPRDIKTTAELLTYFDSLLVDAKQSLAKVTDTELDNE